MSEATRPRLAHATRFFARLVSFDLECPHCGTVYTIKQQTGKGRTARAGMNWDPTTGRFRCTLKDCAHNYVLGIVAWPIGGGGKVASATPADQVPHPRQLAQMRKDGGGWWMPETDNVRHVRPQETNLTTEEDRPDRDDADEELEEP